MSKIISKSKYLLGLQCPKLLWNAVRKPESIPAPDEATQARFDQGHEIGRLAQLLWPGGQGIPWEMGSGDKITTTRGALAGRKPIYEATFADGQVYAQVDILAPANRGAWNIHEVKSSTSVKPQYLPDVAFQKYACEKTGLKVCQCFLVHIDNAYVRKGTVDAKGLFAQEEVTKEIKEASW